MASIIESVEKLMTQAMSLNNTLEDSAKGGYSLRADNINGLAAGISTVVNELRYSGSSVFLSNFAALASAKQLEPDLKAFVSAIERGDSAANITKAGLNVVADIAGICEVFPPVAPEARIINIAANAGIMAISAGQKVDWDSLENKISNWFDSLRSEANFDKVYLAELNPKNVSSLQVAPANESINMGKQAALNLSPKEQSHPDNAHFVSALERVTDFNQRKGLADGDHTVNAAAGILVASVALGHTKVEGVFVQDGQFNFAQMQNGILKTGSVDIAVATTPAELSFAKLPQAHEQHAQTLALDEAPKRNKQHSSPSMS